MSTSKGKKEVLTDVVIVKNAPLNFGNPSPLGMAGVGITFFILSGFYFHMYELDSTVCAAALFIGGFMTMISGVLHFYKSEMFLLVFFCSISVYFMWIPLPLFLHNAWGFSEGNYLSNGFYFIIWIVQSLVLFVASFKYKILDLLHVFFIIMVVYLTFASISSIVMFFGYPEGASVLEYITGVWALLLGLIGLYSSGGKTVNENYGKVIFPESIPFNCLKKKKKKKSDPLLGDNNSEAGDEELEEKGEEKLGEEDIKDEKKGDVSESDDGGTTTTGGTTTGGDDDDDPFANLDLENMDSVL